MVKLFDGSGAVIATGRTSEVNHLSIAGLQPDTGYRYRVVVDGEDWAAGERWDWGPVERGGVDLRPAGRSRTTVWWRCRSR